MKRIARVPCGFGGALFHLPWRVCSTICGRRVAKPHRQALVLVVQPVVLDHHILVLDIAGLCLCPDCPRQHITVHVRFAPESGHSIDAPACPLRAKSGLMQCKNSFSAIIRDGYYEPAEVVIGELLRKSACTDASFVVD